MKELLGELGSSVSSMKELMGELGSSGGSGVGTSRSSHWTLPKKMMEPMGMFIHTPVVTPDAVSR